MSEAQDPFSAPFGTLFGDSITVAAYDGSYYLYSGAAQPLEDFSLHPGAHVLHYGSACFEGLKAHRQVDGSLAIFRLDDHVARFEQSADRLRLPYPGQSVMRQMIIDAVEANASFTPDTPGSLYIRPTLIGTEVNVGAAASPSSTALAYVVNCPVGDYFAGGIRPLTLAIESAMPRTTPQFGMVKTGANYAMALGVTLDAKRDHVADQVLFSPGGDITETGAANFFMVGNGKLITRHLDESFLHGVTRSSVIELARDLDYDVEERELTVAELVALAPEGEVFLTGTAAVISPVGNLVVDGSKVPISDGQPGEHTMKLREALVDIQIGKAADPHGWRTTVNG